MAIGKHKNHSGPKMTNVGPGRHYGFNYPNVLLMRHEPKVSFRAYVNQCICYEHDDRFGLRGGESKSFLILTIAIFTPTYLFKYCLRFSCPARRGAICVVIPGNINDLRVLPIQVKLFSRHNINGVYAQSYDLLFFTVSIIVKWVQKINCYDFKTVSPRKSSHGTVCTVIIFYTLPATARSHPTDHYGPSTLSENIKRNKYSYSIQELDVYRANEATFSEEMCSYQLCQVQK